MINPMALQQIMANAQQMQMFQQQFQTFAQQFQNPSNQFYQQQVQQKLGTGEMSQQDFEQCRRMANALMGVNY